MARPGGWVNLWHPCIPLTGPSLIHGFFPMSKFFDLVSDPVQANLDERGLLEHIATQQNRNRVSMLAEAWLE